MSSNNTIKNFNFSFSLAQSAKKELEEEHSALNDRINNIVDSEKFFVNGFPVLKNIIILQPTKADLKRISKALDRLADLLDIFKELDSKMSVIKTVQDNPNWFAWTFGDFSSEIDKDIDSFFNTEE